MGELPSMGSHRVGHYWSDLAAAAAACCWGEGEGGHLSKGWLLLPWQWMDKNFYRQRERVICRNNRVSSDSHLEIGHRWSDQCHLDCFKYSYSSVPGLVCFHFSRSVLRTVAAYVMATVRSSCSSLPGGIFSTYKTAHRIWLRILSTALEKELRGPWLCLMTALLLFGLL